VNERTSNDRKILGVVIAVLVVIIAGALLAYNMYVDRVDPVTGKTADAAQTMAEVVTPSDSAAQDVVVMAADAPAFKMEDADGKTVNLSDFKGKPVVLNFWTSWCHFCKDEMPYFEAAYKQYGDKVQFIMLNVVNSERNSEDGKNFIKSSAYTFPVFYETEGEVMALYGLRGFPATVFIDANGNIIDKNIGAITQKNLNKSIQTLVGE